MTLYDPKTRVTTTRKVTPITRPIPSFVEDSDHQTKEVVYTSPASSTTIRTYPSSTTYIKTTAATTTTTTTTTTTKAPFRPTKSYTSYKAVPKTASSPKSTFLVQATPTTTTKYYKPIVSSSSAPLTTSNSFTLFKNYAKHDTATERNKGVEPVKDNKKATGYSNIQFGTTESTFAPTAKPKRKIKTKTLLKLKKKLNTEKLQDLLRERRMMLSALKTKSDATEFQSRLGTPAKAVDQTAMEPARRLETQEQEEEM